MMMTSEQAPPAPPPLKYTPPEWSGDPESGWHFEVIKDGAVAERIPLDTHPFLVAGRLEECDIVGDHPSLSRHHAVIQHSREGGVFVFDLGSTHGTKINKTALRPRQHHQLRVGEMVRFGMSSRLYVLGASPAIEAREETFRAALEEKARRVLDKASEHRMEERDAGVSWGLTDDDGDGDDDDNAAGSEETDEAGTRSRVVVPGAVMPGDSTDTFYEDDPSKHLRAFFEREGAALHMPTEESGPGHARVYTARVELPVYDVAGAPLVAEAAVQGRRRQAMQACALVACQMLHELVPALCCHCVACAHTPAGCRRGVLRPKAGESAVVRAKRTRAQQNEDDDDGNDEFFDRTGGRKVRKMGGANSRTSSAADGVVAIMWTHVTAVARVEQLRAELAALATTATEASEAAGLARAPFNVDNEVADTLDAFMASVGQADFAAIRAQTAATHTTLATELREMEALSAKLAPVNFNVLVPLRAHALVLPSVAKVVPVPAPVVSVNVEVAARAAPVGIEGVGAEAAAPVPPAAPVALDARDDTPALLRLDDDAGGLVIRKITTPHAASSVAVVAKVIAKPAVKAKKASKTAPSWQSFTSEFDDDWVPPTTQSGDGRTSLNDKLGY